MLVRICQRNAESARRIPCAIDLHIRDNVREGLQRKLYSEVLAYTAVISAYSRPASKVNGQGRGWSARYTADYQLTSCNANTINIKWRGPPVSVSLLLSITSHNNTSATTELSTRISNPPQSHKDNHHLRLPSRCLPTSSPAPLADSATLSYSTSQQSQATPSSA
jgi:hypothetical protein